MRLICVVLISYLSSCFVWRLVLAAFCMIAFFYSTVSARISLPRQILVWCDGVGLLPASLVGPRLFGRSWLSSHMVFSRVACVVASRLDLACLVSARRGLRG